MTPEQQKEFIMEGVLAHKEACTRAAAASDKMLDVEVGHMDFVVIEETMTSNPIRHEISLIGEEREIFMRALAVVAAERKNKLIDIDELVEKAENIEWK